MESEYNQPAHRKSCSVPNCGLRDQKLFQLPKKEPLRSEWMRLLHVSNSTKRWINVCARHFRPEDFSVKCVQRARLTRRAKPSLYLPLQPAVPKERRRCALPGCQKGRRDGVTLHVFPRLEERCKQWQKLCNLDKTPTRGMNICSRHFLPDDFNMKGDVLILKKSAMPSQHLEDGRCTVNPREFPADYVDTMEVVPELSPHGSISDENSDEAEFPESSSDISRQMALEVAPNAPMCTPEGAANDGDHASNNDRSVMIKNDPDEKPKPIKSEVPLEMVCYEDDEDEDDVNAKLPKECDFFPSVISSHFSQVHGKPLVDDCECQSSQGGPTVADFPSEKESNTGHHHFTLLDLIKGDVQLRAFFGVSSATLDNLTELVLEQISKTNFHQKEPYLKEKIALTLCRLRLKLSFECLAALFGIDRWLCGQYFASTVHLLALVLQGAVYWPSREEISHNMPKCFSQFHDTRVVLGCAKIFVKVPNCVKCRRRLFSFSHYKEAQSIKIMVGVAPSGVFTLLSKVCGGKTPDHHIFKESDLITKNMLTPKRDAVMVDKDFSIDDVCKEQLIKVYRVPFVRRDKKSSDSENGSGDVDLTLARVHIDMAIQRLKTFKILTGKLTLCEIPYIDDVFTVIAGIVNLNTLE